MSIEEYCKIGISCPNGTEIRLGQQEPTAFILSCAVRQGAMFVLNEIETCLSGNNMTDKNYLQLIQQKIKELKGE